MYECVCLSDMNGSLHGPPLRDSITLLVMLLGEASHAYTQEGWGEQWEDLDRKPEGG